LVRPPLLERTRESKLTVRAYVGSVLILSVLVSFRLWSGRRAANQYYQAVLKPMQLVCSTPGGLMLGSGDQPVGE
jgi:hypothetical protein